MFHLRLLLQIRCKYVLISRAIALTSHARHLGRAGYCHNFTQKVHIIQPFDRYKKPAIECQQTHRFGSIRSLQVSLHHLRGFGSSL